MGNITKEVIQRKIKLGQRLNAVVGDPDPITPLRSYRVDPSNRRFYGQILA